MTSRDVVLDNIVNLVAEIATSLERVAATIEDQTTALEIQSVVIKNKPSERYTLILNGAAVLLITAVVLFSNAAVQSQTDELARTALKNAAVVEQYCSVSELLPECASQGSLAVKATTIQTNCAIFRTVFNAQPVDVREQTVYAAKQGCQKLGY